jgi:hypothetical protein
MLRTWFRVGGHQQDHLGSAHVATFGPLGPIPAGA